MFLQRALQRHQTTSLFAKSMQMRSMQTVAGKNYVVPESVQDVVQSLDKQRPIFTLLYFTAAWNPMCEKIERDYENLTAANPQFTHIRVDCDEHPLIKRYFDARVEPMFIYLINGGEVERCIGYNFEKITKTAENVVDYHNNNSF